MKNKVRAIEAPPADMRGSLSYRRVSEIYEQLLRPGQDAPFAVQNPVFDNAQPIFLGTRLTSGFDAPATTRTYRVDSNGEACVARDDARLVRTSDSTAISAIVVAAESTKDEVLLSRIGTSTPIARWHSPGSVDSLIWSPNGEELLLLVTGDVSKDAGIRGARVHTAQHDGPAWLPYLETPQDTQRWQSLWVWRPDCDSPRRLTAAGFNPWEAAWLGNDKLLVVASPGYEEGSWYQSALWSLPTDGSTGTILRRPDNQIGCPTASPNGAHVAWIEGVASGRSGVSGDVVHQPSPSDNSRANTNGVDVTHLVWRDNSHLMFSGIRGLETVVGEIHWETGSVNELWSSTSETICGWVPAASPAGSGDTLIAVESYEQPPALLSLQDQKSRTLLAAAAPATQEFGQIQPISWEAPDGLEIQGWLILPPAEKTRPRNGWPLLVDIHGGPISAHRNRWSANLRAAPVLANQGWAILLPNPRGSIGRGQSFASAVIGDMGGADAFDITSGIDLLAQQGTIDPKRIVLSGNSYGGFMSALLVTRSVSFAAAISICPVANWTSQHFASHIGWFDQEYLRASPSEPVGPYLSLSPVFLAQNVSTPTLVLGGLLDRDTPSTQAIELYNAFREAGAPCALGIYPEEGHGLFGIPAYIDSAARILDWTTRYASG